MYITLVVVCILNLLGYLCYIGFCMYIKSVGIFILHWLLYVYQICWDIYITLVVVCILNLLGYLYYIGCCMYITSVGIFILHWLLYVY